MNLGGNFDLFSDAFPTDFLPAVFTLILEEWPNSPRPDDKPLENRITNRFVGHLNNEMRKRKLPTFKLLVRPKLADATSDSETGEVDIYIDSFSRHPDAFFVFECKRLNVRYDSRFESEASDYVGDKGMGCFISGQYPATCDCGGMLGYVMDGDIESAITAINRALKSHRKTLRLRQPHSLEPAAIVTGNRIQQTNHNLDQHNFIIYHLLLPY